MMIDLELPEERKSFFFNFLESVWEIAETISNIEVHPAVFVLVSSDCKTVMQEKTPIAVMTVSEVYLVVGFDFI